MSKLLTKLYPLSILTAAGGVLCGGPDYIISFVPLRSVRIFRVSNVLRLEPSLLLHYLPLNIFTASKGSNFHILLYKIRNQVIQTNSWKSYCAPLGASGKRVYAIYTPL